MSDPTGYPPAGAGRIGTTLRFGSDFDPVTLMTVASSENSLIPRTRIMRTTTKLLPGVPQASGLVFGWCVTDASYELEPSIVKAQFGDGYAQRRPTGINTQVHMWSVTMKNIDAKTAQAVTDFLAARNGVDIFNWTPPRTTTPQDVICPSWSSAYGDLIADGSRLLSVSMKFEQAYI